MILLPVPRWVSRTQSDTILKSWSMNVTCWKHGDLPFRAEHHHSSLTQKSLFVPSGQQIHRWTNPEVIAPNLTVVFQRSELEVT